MVAARSGDRDALDRLLRRHHERVHAVCRRITGTNGDADDATQEALLRIVRGLDHFDGRSAFTTWIYRIATNAALDELRRRARRPVVLRTEDSSEDRWDEVSDPISHRRVESVVDAMMIDAALAALPHEHRVAVVLRDVADLDYDEIAAILGVPLGTVKSRIARGRMRLVRQLADVDVPDDHASDGPSVAGSVGDPNAAGNRTTPDERPND